MAANQLVAPMMDWTDRHCRYLHRSMLGETLLHTDFTALRAGFSNCAYALFLITTSIDITSNVDPTFRNLSPFEIAAQSVAI